MTRTALLLAAAFSAAATLAAPAASAQPAAGSPPAAGEVRVYFGTYSGGKTGSKGIYTATLDPATGKLSVPVLAGEATNPSFVAIHPDKKHLYAVAEVDAVDGKKAGGVAAFAINPDGTLAPLNRKPSGGTGPCYVSLDRDGRHVLVANYGSGAVACLPITADGALADPSATVQHVGSGPDPKRQAGPHAHSINLDAANRFAIAADLGLDKLLVYKFDAAAGTLTPNDTPAGMVAPGSGPRHLAWSPSGAFAYVISEMANTVTVFKYDAGKGTLADVQVVPTLPADFKGASSTAEVAMHPTGKFLYGSNRGHDSIAVFAVDAATGKLTPAGIVPTGGKSPRHFGIDPSGQYLLAANQDSGTVTTFRIGPASGGLSRVGEPTAVPKPVCVKFLLR
ncbi:MAG: pgl [Phycisphaerales bacterium]|nr:pgl [Phycisphaerales bacterium]